LSTCSFKKVKFIEARGSLQHLSKFTLVTPKESRGSHTKFTDFTDHFKKKFCYVTTIS